MKNYDFVLILVCLFVLRIILLSGSYPDSICLAAILLYRLADKYLKQKKISDSLEEQVKKNEELVKNQIQVLADEVVKIRNTTEGFKAAINLGKK
jgi:hypothetical protein